MPSQVYGAVVATTATHPELVSQENDSRPPHHAPSSPDKEQAVKIPFSPSPLAEISRLTSDSSTLILFDWDDTLLASTHLSNNGFRIDSQDEIPTHTLEQLSVLQDSVISLLTLSFSLGTPCIITNAEHGWVQLSCQRFLPGVFPILEKLHVFSARTTYEQKFPDLPSKWKLEAFTHHIGDVRYADSKNVISLGDSHAERDAVRAVTSGITDVRTKSVKFLERPSILDLTKQLRAVLNAFHTICQLDSDLDLWVVKPDECEGQNDDDSWGFFNHNFEV